MNFVVQVLLIVISCLILYAETKLVMINEFAKVIQSDENYIIIKEFKFYKKTRTFAALNASFTLVEEITDDYTKVLVSLNKFKDNEYKSQEVHFAFPMCQFAKHNLLNVRNPATQTNITTCPFYKDDYYMYDAAPGPEWLPPFFSPGKWMLEIRLRHKIKNKIVATVQWMMSIRDVPE